MSALADLATLAAEKVPGFVVPMRGRLPDDSPAALLMAVAAWTMAAGSGVFGRWRELRISGPTFDDMARYVRAATVTEISHCDCDDATPESIARAALVALLRAHGVEVPT